MDRFSYHCKTDVINFTTIIDAGHLSIYFVMSHATSYNSHNVTLLNQSISNLLTCKLSTLCDYNGLLGINFSTYKFQSPFFKQNANFLITNCPFFTVVFLFCLQNSNSPGHKLLNFKVVVNKTRTFRPPIA